MLSGGAIGIACGAGICEIEGVCRMVVALVGSVVSGPKGRCRVLWRPLGLLRWPLRPVGIANRHIAVSGRSSEGGWKGALIEGALWTSALVGRSFRGFRFDAELSLEF